MEASECPTDNGWTVHGGVTYSALTFDAAGNLYASRGGRVLRNMRSELLCPIALRFNLACGLSQDLWLRASLTFSGT